MINGRTHQRGHSGGRFRTVALGAALGVVVAVGALDLSASMAAARTGGQVDTSASQEASSGGMNLAPTDITCVSRGKAAGQLSPLSVNVSSMGGSGQLSIPAVGAGDFDFTDPYGAESSYHVSTTGVDFGCQWGILFWLEGDQDWDSATETMQTSIPDDQRLSDLARVAAEANLVFVAPDSPDRSDPDSLTWWENYGSDGEWFRSLAHTLIDQWGASTDDLWFTGYSGGAEFISAELMSNDPSWIHGGGAVMIGGGEIIRTPDRAPEALTSMPMTWMVGSEDVGFVDDSDDESGGESDDESSTGDESDGGAQSDEAGDDGSSDVCSPEAQSDLEQSDQSGCEQSDQSGSGALLDGESGLTGADPASDTSDGESSDDPEFGPEDHSDDVWSPVAVATQAQSVFSQRGYTKTSLIILPGLRHTDYDVAVLVASALGVTPPQD